MLEQELMLRQMKYKIEKELEPKEKAVVKTTTPMQHMSLLKDKMAFGMKTTANMKNLNGDSNEDS